MSTGRAIESVVRKPLKQNEIHGDPSPGFQDILSEPDDLSGHNVKRRLVGWGMATKSMAGVVVLLSLGAAGASQCLAQDYFPLQLGNQWIYRSSFGGGRNATQVQVDIPRQELVDGRVYSVVRGFADAPVWLRSDDGGVLYQYDPGTRVESVWAEFRAAVGTTYRTTINPCNQQARVESRNAVAKTPAGEFAGALSIRYPAANCADAGLESELYVPYIGLVQRTSQTIAGPRVMTLTYARISGVTVFSEPELTFGLTIDKFSYKGGSMQARLTLRSTHERPQELQFRTSQQFEVVFRKESGEQVFRWSDEMFFLTVLTSERVGPGERHWPVTIPLDGIPDGGYVVEAWLTTLGERPRFFAAVPFEVAR